MLRLDACEIRNGGEMPFFLALSHNRTLDSSELSNWHIDSSVLTAIGQALSHHNETLRELMLREARVDSMGAIAITEILTHNRSLVRLDIQSNRLGTKDISSIAESLQHNASLECLNLSQNAIGDEGAAAISNALRLNETLRELTIDQTCLGDGGKMIAEALRDNGNMQQLSLVHSGLNPSCGSAFGASLEYNEALHELNLGSNILGDEAGIALINGLGQNKTLRVLKLFVNWISDAAGDAIENALKHNSSLQELSFADNGIGDSGTRCIGEGLKNNRSLTKLSLSSNQIGTEGVGALIGALVQNMTLRELNLQNSLIDDNGASIIAAFVRCTDCNLSCLGLSGACGVSGNGARDIADALKHNTSLQELSLDSDYNGIRSDDWEAIILGALKRNTTLLTMHFRGIPFFHPLGKQVGGIMRRSQVIAEKQPVIMQEDNLTMELWSYIIAKWPTNVLFEIFRQKPNPFLANNRQGWQGSECIGTRDKEI